MYYKIKIQRYAQGYLLVKKLMVGNNVMIPKILGYEFYHYPCTIFCIIFSCSLEWYTPNLQNENDWCFRPQLCTVRLNCTGDNLGEWDEFCYKTCPRCRINRSTCWPAVRHITIELQIPPQCTLFCFWYLFCWMMHFKLACHCASF